MRSGIAALLRDAGLEVTAEASSAEELLRDIDEHEPDAEEGVRILETLEQVSSR
jgi:DNA-binding NarL/FixJ family response regulator